MNHFNKYISTIRKMVATFVLPQSFKNRSVLFQNSSMSTKTRKGRDNPFIFRVLDSLKIRFKSFNKTSANKFFALLFTLGAAGNASAGLVVGLNIEAGESLTIRPSEVTKLQLTFANNNVATPISALAFNESLPGTLPNGLKVAGIPTNSCGGTLTAPIDGQSIMLIGGTVPTNGNCVIIIPVTAGTSSGSGTTYTYTIPVGAVTGNDGAPQSNTGLDLNQSIGVLSIARPAISKSFSGGTNIILNGAAKTLSIVITNQDNNIDLTGVSIVDDLPAQGAGGALIEVANPTNASAVCTGGGSITFAPNIGDVSISATGGTIPSNSNCILTVNVIGRHTNTGYQSSSRTNRIEQDNDFDNDIGIEPPNDATDNIRVVSPLSVSKSFNNNSVASGQSDTVRIRLTNNGSADLTITTFDDDPIDNGAVLGLVATAVTNTCGGVSTVISAGEGIQLVGGNIPAGGNCDVNITFNAFVEFPGVPIIYTNSIPLGAVGVINPPGLVIISRATSDNILVFDDLDIIKNSSPSSAAPGSPVRFSVTVNNYLTTPRNNVIISDTLANNATYLTGIIDGNDYNPTVSPAGCGVVDTSLVGDTTAVLTITSIPARTDENTPGTCTVAFYAMTDPAGGSNTSNQLPSGSVCYGPGIPPVDCNGGSSNSVSVNETDTLVATKNFIPSGPLNEGVSTTLIFTLNNRSPNPLTNVSLTDNLPSDGSGQLQIANPANASSTCGSPIINAVPGSTSITLTGGMVPPRSNSGFGADGTCSFSVNVVGPAGNYNNNASVTADRLDADGIATTPVSDNTITDSIVYNSVVSGSKNFSPSSVSVGGTSTVVATIGNAGSQPLTGTGIIDSLPAGMIVANPANAYTTCSGSTSITANAGAVSATLSGATVAPMGSCDFVFDVTVTTLGNKTNTLAPGDITADAGVINQNPISDTLNVSAAAPILILKEVSPSVLTFPGEITQLRIEMTNSTTAVTGLGFIDYFTIDGTPGAVLNGMQIASVPNTSTTCVGGTVTAAPLSASVSLSGVSLSASGVCEVFVDVTTTVVGGLSNFIPPSGILTDQGITNIAQATTSVTTQSNLGVVKEFIPNVLNIGEVGRLRLTFYNSDPLSASSLSVIDNLPAGVSVPAVANPVTTCVGAIVTAPTTTSVQVNSGFLAGAVAGVPATCYAEINVVASAAGSFTNDIPAGDVTAIIGGTTVTNPNPTTDVLEVREPLIIHKAFSNLTSDTTLDGSGFSTGIDGKLPGNTAVLTLYFENPNSIPLTKTILSASLPPGLFLNQTPNASTTCALGIVSASPSGTSVGLTDATVPAGGSCTVTVEVVSNTAGTYTCSIDEGSVFTDEGVTNDDTTEAVIVYFDPPTVEKSFSPPVIPANGVSTLTITINNDNDAVMTLTSNFTDNLPNSPGAMTVAAGPVTGGTCPGTISASPGGTSVTYTNGSTVPPGGCTITVDVTANTTGVYVNTIDVGDLETDLGDNQDPTTGSIRVSGLGYISGQVFQDNSPVPNGTFETGDLAIEGNPIDLRTGANCSGAIISSILTDALGNYLFSQLPAATYSVCQGTQPPATLNSITTAGIIEVNSGGGGTAGTASNSSPITSEIISIILLGTATDVSGSPQNDFSEIVTPSDFGDAPDLIYSTTQANNGPRHIVIPELFMGSCVDSDADGQGNVSANGDDIGATSVITNGICVAVNDDEDSLTPPLLQDGQTTPDTQVQVAVNNTTGGDAYLACWVDYNGSAGFELTERSATVTVASGATSAIVTLIDVPANANMATGGSTYMRCRIAIVEAEIDDPTGLANSGEIEDYPVVIENAVYTPSYDWADAPDSDFSTAFANNGPHHLLDTELYMGSCVDDEADGQANLTANGDDTNNENANVNGSCLVPGDDEDSLIPPLLQDGQTSPNTQVQVAVNNTTGADAYLTCWINYNAASTGFEASEQSALVTVANGASSVTVTLPDVPVTASSDTGGTSYMRCRLASSASEIVTAVGPSANGEVEDYLIVIEATVFTPSADWGDAPTVDFSTLQANNGPNHILDPNLFMGLCVDDEVDGQPNFSAGGDDQGNTSTSTLGVCAVANDDEDSLTPPIFIDGQVAPSFNVDVTNTTGSDAYLSCWVNYNANSTGFEATERSAITLVPNGVTSVFVTMPNVPATASTDSGGFTYMRCRIASAGTEIEVPTGLANNGEVEDYNLLIEPAGFVPSLDWADAPDANYSTTMANNGPRHGLDLSLYLGSCVDNELDGQPNANADGDDTNIANSNTNGSCLATGDDEDSLTPPLLQDGQTNPVIPVSVVNTTTNDAYLACWVNYNDPTTGFEASERSATVVVANGATSVNVILPSVPATANADTGGVSYLRCRIANNASEINNPTGYAITGEVEDYLIDIQTAVFVPSYDWGDAPTADFATSNADNGPNHRLDADLFMGSCVDDELDGQPNAAAFGDDSGVANANTIGTCTSANDDEDSLTPPMLFDGQVLPVINIDVNNTTGSDAYLSCWVNYNAAVSGFELSERSAIVTVANGASSVNVTLPTVPGAASTDTGGSSYLRCRLAGMASEIANPTGAASDGEVEDYPINITSTLTSVFDWADAPDLDFSTTLVNNGPRHGLDANLYMGDCVDDDANGQPIVGATGDDDAIEDSTLIGTCVETGDDEDSLTPPMLVEGQLSPTVNVEVTNTTGADAYLACWVNYNAAATGFELSERSLITTIANGATSAVITLPDVPFTANTDTGGTSYMRCRITTISSEITNAVGEATNGEVEDYLVVVESLGVVPSLDWADAPDADYLTLGANNGPRHGLDATLYMGACVDDELDGQPNVTADGDDLGAANANTEGVCATVNDDEDSLTPPTLLNGQVAPTINVAVTNTTGVDAFLACWVNYNNPVTGFETSERSAILTIANGATSGLVTLPDVPLSANIDTGGTSYMRCRIASTGSEVADATGLATNGEVEDYVVSILPAFTLGDYVWYDANQDGIQDATEVGVNGVTATLFSDSACTAGNELGVPVVTANGGMPAADGFYEFTNLNTGIYCVEFTNIPVGYTVSPTGATTDDLDSDATITGDPTIAQIQNIALSGDDPDEDMGIYAPGTVSGVVWCESDTNANTTYDAGDADTLQSNIGVTLYDDANCNDVLDGSEASSAVTQDTVAGSYLFTNLITGGPGAGNNPPGCYLVAIDTADPDLGVCDNPITPSILTPDIDAPNSDNPGNDFGHNEELSLGDFVWYDSNQDGVQDIGEPGINGVTVNLYNNPTCSGAIAQTTVTANVGNDGFYQFTPLASGMYCVEFVPPAGFTISPTGAGTPATDSNADINGQVQDIDLQDTDITIDMGVFVPGSVSGVVWCESDTNANTTYDAGDADTLQSNIGVTLYDDANCNDLLDGSETSSAVTQDTVAGSYLFANLITGGPGAGNNPPGCYLVAIDTADPDLGVCDNPITPSILTPDIDAPNPDNPGNDFGHNEELSLGDFVWYDSNQDGVQDIGEPGINGVTVNLYNNPTCSGAIAQTTVTANVGNDGFYQFTPLASSMYCVEFIPPIGFTISPTGSDTTATDSNADSNGQVLNIDLQDTDPTIDMGVYVPGSVSGVVWCESDTNANTTYDAGDADTLQSNIEVILYDDANCNDTLDGSEASSAVTQDTVAGNYLFSNLITGGPGTGDNPPGCYIVEVDTTDPDLGVCDNPITPIIITPKIDAQNPDNPENNFGHNEELSLGNFVWYDNDQDGIQDPTEIGVNGIKVDLYNTFDCSGSILDSTVTSSGGLPVADGYYQFSPLASGPYCLTFSNLPNEWVFTQMNQGSDESKDSDVDSLTGQILNIDLQNSDPDEDVGIYAPIGTIPGRMFCDSNPGNGSFDPGEAQADLTINLYRDTDCNGQGDVLYASVSTDINGEFEFIDLPVANTPIPPNLNVCYVVTYDAMDSDLGDCTTPILPEDAEIELSVDDPDADPVIFGTTYVERHMIPVNSIWSLLLLSILILIFARRREFK